MTPSELYQAALPILIKIAAVGPYILAAAFAGFQALLPERAFRDVHRGGFWALYSAMTFLGFAEIAIGIAELKGTDHIGAGLPVLIGSIGTVPAVILSFSVLLRSASFENVPGTLGAIDSIYLSVVTFTTLGYGDITPEDRAGKVLTATLVLISYILFPVIVAELTASNVPS